MLGKFRRARVAPALIADRTQHSEGSIECGLRGI